MALRAHPTIPSDLTPEQVFYFDTSILHALWSGMPTLIIRYWITKRFILLTFARDRLEAGYNLISYTPFSSEVAWTRLHTNQAISNTISIQINETNPQKIPSQASSISTSSAPTTPPAHSSTSNNTVDPTLALIALMQQSLQQNVTIIAQLNSCSSPYPAQTKSLPYQFKPQRPPFPKWYVTLPTTPPVPGTNRYLQCQGLLRRHSQLDTNDTDKQTAQRCHQLGHAGFASIIYLIDVSQ